jgi:hypothetical protein
MRNTLLLLTFIITIFACNTKHDYPADVTQNFMNSCQMTSGGNQEICSCLLDKIQKKYTYEEFSVIEVKMKAGQTPTDFLDFVGKVRAECSKK